MTFRTSAALACGVTIFAGLAATHPEDLRRFRWLRICVSLPIVILIASVFYQLDQVRGYFGLWAVGALALLWAGPVAHGASWVVQQLVYADQHRITSGVQADFNGARALRKHGDLHEAIELLEAELEKEPHSYEGLLLLSEILEESGDAEKSASAVERLLRTPGMTSEQRRYASDRWKTLNARIPPA